MIKAIIFDCFGVLALDGLVDFRDRHFKTDSDSLVEFEANNTRCDRGLMSYADFVTWLSKKTDLKTSEVRRQIEKTSPNIDLFEFIKYRLKPSYKIGLLSNAGQNWLNDLFEPWQVELFDEVTLSYQLGSAKPDRLMYENIAAKLDLSMDECLFVDDNKDYCRAAEQFGMIGVNYSDNKQLFVDLKGVINA